MSGKPYKALLALITLICFVGVSLTQRELAKDRDALGLNRFTELKGAPPVLELTTVALGGFRGLISNILWIRANDLQENDKFFEMMQLADWITKLEPHFTQVWTHEAWNMAYNISVKFREPSDRWRWVERGIELLRDDGLRYNPDDVLIHRELAWFFQHKMGANLDDAQWYYKQMWASEMSKIFETNHPNWNELINPQTPDAKRRAELLRNKYKMDPQVMEDIDKKYGPLEWRLPEAHAIYWAYEGLQAAKRNPRRINPDDLITLQRVIYQSMQLSFQRGRLVLDNPSKPFEHAARTWTSSRTRARRMRRKWRLIRRTATTSRPPIGTFCGTRSSCFTCATSRRTPVNGINIWRRNIRTSRCCWRRQTVSRET